MRVVSETAALGDELDDVADRDQQLFALFSDIKGGAEELADASGRVLGVLAEGLHAFDECLERLEGLGSLASISVGHAAVQRLGSVRDEAPIIAGRRISRMAARCCIKAVKS